MSTLEDEKRHLGELQRDYLTSIAQLGQLANEIARLAEDVRNDKYPERTYEVLARTRDVIDYIESLTNYLQMTHNRIEEYEHDEEAHAEKELELLNEENRRKNLEMFGMENPSDAKEYMTKMKQTILEKYGVLRPTSNWGSTETTSCLEKYGVKNEAEMKEIKERAKRTCLEKYGVEYPPHATQSRHKFGSKQFYTEDDIS